jgi:TonB-linked SusC/RagA family outer membrane protein
MNNRYILQLVFTGFLLAVGLNRTAAQSVAAANPNDTIAVIPATVQGRLFNISTLSSTGAVSSVSGNALQKNVVPNLTNTLYGLLPGLTVTQGNGEPSFDDAYLAIRGVGSYGYLGGAGGYNTAKIFVDGFETNRNYLRSFSPAEIESISILKDAAALSTFGMRGANGVIYITTKRGQIGKPTVQFQARTGLQRPTNINKPLNAYGYANLYNQAISNDKGNVWTPFYTPDQLQAYQNSTGVNVDWYSEVLRAQTPYTDGNLSFTGGDTTTRYNVILNYANQQGLYDVANKDATSNEMLKRYNVRTNLDFSFFKIFEAKVDLGGRIEDLKSPNYVTSRSTAGLWDDLARYPSNIYQIRDGDTENWSGTALYPNNPVASVKALGWASSHARILQGNFSLRERLDFITKGLFLSEAFSINSYALSTYNKTASYARFFNGVTTTTAQTTPLRATGQSAAGQEDWKQGTVTLGYQRAFGDHAITSAVNYHESNYRGDGVFSFAYHYQNISGRANYTYKNKYVGEFGFSYFGSDAYAKGNRFGFYPSVSAAWIISNETFLLNNKVVNYFKLRASVGKSGSADTEGAGSPVSGQNGRFLYQQYYNASGTFYMGDGSANANNSLRALFIANPDIFAEQSIKYNIGADINLFKKLNLSLDAYMDKRSGILTRDNSLSASYGNNILIRNLGKQTNKGFEATASYTDRSGKLGYSLMGMASFNSNTIDYMAELATAYGYNAVTGRSFGTPIGLVSNGFYQLEDFNADGTLKAGQSLPQFGRVQAGDLKYRDLDNNGKVDDNDRTAIGDPGIPKLTYAFGANINFMNFDLGTLLQGAGGSSINILNYATQTQAFVNNGNAYEIAQGAWAYYPNEGIDTRSTATYPRLTTATNANNYRTSSFWIKSGNFLRIRNIELGYTFSARLINRIGLSKLRVFVNATNPVTWSSLLKHHHMDPETQSGYPALKSYNTGLSVTF